VAVALPPTLIAEPGSFFTARAGPTPIVQGAAEFYRNGLGDIPNSVREHTAQYREDIDPLEPLFEAQVLEAADDAWTATSELFGA
jgi:hypothetical protein